MKEGIKHQEEKTPEKPLEQRMEEFIKGMREEIKKDSHLEKFDPDELLKAPLKIYEGIKDESLSVDEFLRIRRLINGFLGWASHEVHDQILKKQAKKKN